jgi:hypothetical protein
VVGLKGQLMLITAVIVSLIMLATGSAVSEIGEQTYTHGEEGYLTVNLKDEAAKVDTRFQKNRENFRKMVGSLDSYTTETAYWETNQCFNITLRNTETNLVLNCVS